MSHNSWFLEKKPLSLYPAELTAGLFGGANLFNGAALASVSLILTPPIFNRYFKKIKVEVEKSEYLETRNKSVKNASRAENSFWIAPSWFNFNGRVLRLITF